jgi:UDP-N-acetylglucosamine 2-epimerase (non-hydrolysing)
MDEAKPDVVLVVGDVNSTLACALVAVKLGVAVAHVEAGLRSGDRSMPEEINRVLTDAISDFLFVTEQSGIVNLAREGVDAANVHFVGNVMIDTLMRHRDKARSSVSLQSFGVQPGQFGLLTLHRPSNVDCKDTLTGILAALEVAQRKLPIVFPIHPRTQKNLETFGLRDRSQACKNLIMTEPLGYLEFLCLMDQARVVLTDSGGIQEETTVLGTPCLTLRENTERPVTLEEGTNRLVGSDPSAILRALTEVMNAPKPAHTRLPKLWDGQAARRIVDVLAR